MIQKMTFIHPLFISYSIKLVYYYFKQLLVESHSQSLHLHSFLVSQPFSESHFSLHFSSHDLQSWFGSQHSFKSQFLLQSLFDEHSTFLFSHAPSLHFDSADLAHVFSLLQVPFCEQVDLHSHDAFSLTHLQFII